MPMIHDRVSAAAHTPASHQRTRRMFQVSWFYLLVAAAFGVLLRLMFVHPVAWFEFAHALHAHSHIAFLGWVYNAIFAIAVLIFVPVERLKRYQRLFWITQLATAGMLVFFPLQGYARESIAFSALHMAFAWIFAWWLWRENHAWPIARLHLRAALAFLVFSSCGPLALGPIMATGNSGSIWYHLAIYFYLHFQYNGWFTFFLQAMVVHTLESRGVPLDPRLARRAFHLFAIGCVLTFALSTLWTEPPAGLQILAATGGALQLAACWIFLRSLGQEWRNVFKHQGRPAQWIASVAIASFLLKLAIQFAGALPGLATLAYGSRHMVIAFLHLVFLGLVSPALIAIALREGWIRQNAASLIGALAFLSGSAATEITLVQAALAPAFQWPVVPHLFHVLLACAGLTLAGVAIMTPSILARRDLIRVKAQQ